MTKYLIIEAGSIYMATTYVLGTSVDMLPQLILKTTV